MRLMILAQPKTASTSLMHAIGELSGKPFAQCFTLRLSRNNDESSIFGFREVYPALDYPALSFFHSDIADFSGSNDMNFFLSADVCKQHFPPTENNIKLLEEVPKVLLIRNPRETIDAYRRVTGSSLHLYKLLNEKVFCERLESEIEAWQNRWLKVAEGSKSMLVITKNDVVNNTRDVVRQILDAMEQEHVVVPENYTLPAKRVSKACEEFQINVRPISD